MRGGEVWAFEAGLLEVASTGAAKLKPAVTAESGFAGAALVEDVGTAPFAVTGVRWVEGEGDCRTSSEPVSSS